MSAWRPVASPQTLRLRARMLAEIRDFFAARGVLEVETPLLASATVTDLHIESIPAAVEFRGRTLTRHLQTSPEYAMKRLLAAGIGPCYQICKSFRQGEAGARHNPEFTMLEWYQPGFRLEQLMDEVEQLLAVLLPSQGAIARLRYRELFRRHLGIDPVAVELAALRQLVAAELSPDSDGLNADNLDAADCLQLLFGRLIEPQLPEYCFVRDYPPDQAALAKIAADDDGQAVARRFELFCGGMEIANGYDEELDAGELRRRFARDQRRREQRGLPVPAIDQKLLAALEHGLPPCAGVALGLDRLLMVLSQTRTIGEVLTFPIDRI